MQLPLEQIIAEHQVRTRFDAERLSELARSLQAVGLQQPIRVRAAGDKWIVIDGERRLRAAKAAGWTTIPAIAEERELSEAELVQRQLVCAVQTADLTDIEKAKAIERILSAGRCTAAEVADKVGLSEGTVSRLRALLLLPPDVQEQIHAGLIPSSTGYEIAKVRSPEARAALLAKAARGELTRDAASRLSRGPRRRAQPRKTGRVLDANRQRVSLMLGGRRACAMPGDETSLAAVIAWLEELLNRLRPLEATDMTLADVARALSNRQTSRKDKTT
jgi:ParB family chromosome partitioning protein